MFANFVSRVLTVNNLIIHEVSTSLQENTWNVNAEAVALLSLQSLKWKIRRKARCTSSNFCWAVEGHDHQSSLQSLERNASEPQDHDQGFWKTWFVAASRWKPGLDEDAHSRVCCWNPTRDGDCSCGWWGTRRGKCRLQAELNFKLQPLHVLWDCWQIKTLEIVDPTSTTSLVFANLHATYLFVCSKSVFKKRPKW